MVAVQLNIFDCDEVIRDGDCVLRRMRALQDEGEIYVGELRIKKAGRFYMVEKGVEWEEAFSDMRDCYEFVNRDLSKLDSIH